ncbi:MAG TPA: nodulation protein NfeD [Stellaceae bacterium]|nr:nodulation protein NfeD [Stellaceae bacterium]
MGSAWRLGRFSTVLAGMIAAALAVAVPAPAQATAQAVVLEIDGAIGPATAEYVTNALHSLDARETRLVVLRLNTPGGLDSSMRAIIAAMLASPVPVAAYVAPSGARAASAGTYITYAAAIAAMAPGTNLGAATPVQLGLPTGAGTPKGQAPEDTETRKIVNDAVAYIRGLAELHGRNADWAEQAVRSAVSLPASEALKLKVIDVIAASLPDLLRQIDGRQVIADGKPVTLATADLAIVRRPPGWHTKLLAIVTDPNIAFILLLIGIAGLVFEFTTPGAIAPGLIGVISLLLALFGLDLLPVDYAGAGLVLLGIALMIAEAHIGTFGVLGIGGIAAFVIGALMMFPGTAPGFSLSRPLLAAVTVVAAGLFLIALSLLLRARRRPVMTGREALIGAEGETVSWNADQGRVRVAGEVWRARAARPLTPGARVRVTDRRGLMLIVEPM